MTFDKNNVAMIAVGALIVGGLAGATIGNEMGDGGRGERDGMWGDKDGMGMMDQGKTTRDNSEQRSADKQNGMMGGRHMMPDGTMMVSDSMGMMVTSEREFIMGMIPHHEEAVTTAKEVIARGGSTPEIKTLAENIVKAQEAEISSMKEWYKNWYGTEYVADGKYKSMMRPLATLSGAELDKVFLTDMVKHHMMAIMMAKSVDAHLEHDEIKTLSNNIKISQSAEIVTMQNLLKTLN